MKRIGYIDGRRLSLLDDHAIGFGTDRSLTITPSNGGLTFNQSELAANGRLAKFTGIIEAPAIPDGQGLFEIDVTLSGTATGSLAITSCWANMGAAEAIALPGANFILHSDGIWQGAGEITDVGLSWMKFQSLLADTDFDTLNLFQLNFAGGTLSAIFNVNNPALALGYQAGTPTKAAVGSVPFFATGATGIHYIYLYDEPDAD